MVGSAPFCQVLKLSFALIGRYIVLEFLPKKTLLLPTNYEIRGLIVSQSGALFKLVGVCWSVHPTNQTYLIFGVFSKDLLSRGTGPLGTDEWTWALFWWPMSLQKYFENVHWSATKTSMTTVQWKDQTKLVG